MRRYLLLPVALAVLASWACALLGGQAYKPVENLGYRFLVEEGVHVERAENWGMTPTIRDGETVLWVDGFGKASPGDLLMCVVGGRRQAARLVSIGELVHLAKDGGGEVLLPPENVLGVVVGVIYL